MVNVSSRIKFNMPQLNKLNQSAIRALEMTAEAVHTDVVQAQVLPRDTGALTTNTFVESKDAAKGRVMIVCQTNYARRLYFHPEYNFSKAENPNARGKWFDDWISGNKKNFARDAFAAFCRREAGL